VGPPVCRGQRRNIRRARDRRVEGSAASRSRPPSRGRCPGFASRFPTGQREVGTRNGSESPGKSGLRPGCPGCPGIRERGGRAGPPTVRESSSRIGQWWGTTCVPVAPVEPPTEPESPSRCGGRECRRAFTVFHETPPDFTIPRGFTQRIPLLARPPMWYDSLRNTAVRSVSRGTEVGIHTDEVTGSNPVPPTQPQV
jgi:hypothetical protein